MNAPAKPSIFSRVIQLVVIGAVLGAALWAGSQILEPAPVPRPPTPKGVVKFDSTVDVSKNTVFSGLRPLSTSEVQVEAVGRPNPFVPVAPDAVIATSTVTTTTSVIQ